MLKKGVISFVNGKFWLMDDEGINYNIFDRSFVYLPIGSSDDTRDNWRGVVRSGEEVYFVNYTQRIGCGWKIVSLGFVDGNKDDIDAEYVLVDKHGEMRYIKDYESGGFYGKNPRTLKYIFDVMDRYYSWVDYDEDDVMMTPVEEDVMERDEEREKIKIRNEWMREFDDRSNKIQDAITKVIQVNANGGPGSRKIAEKMLNDINSMVYNARWDRLHDGYVS